MTDTIKEPGDPKPTLERVGDAAEDEDEAEQASRFNLEMDPLDQIDESEKPQNVNVLCNRWIWITGIERFVNRVDPTVAWKVSQFDSEFNYLCGKGASSIGKYLFKRRDILRRFRGPVFIPGAPELNVRNYNLWRPSPIRPKENPEKLKLWNDHLAFLYPNQADRDLVLDWLAWVLQHPSEMPKEALLLTGVFGTGKSLIARVMEQIEGENNTQRPKNSSLKGQFNTWMDKAKLVIVEELLQTGQREIAHELRDVITEPTAEVNTKFIPAYKIASYLAMIAISNEANAFPIAWKDRRWRVVESPITHEQQAAAVAKGYFRKIMPLCDTRKHPPQLDKEFIAAIAWDLLHRETPGVLNWTHGNAPRTTAKDTMIELRPRP